VVTDDADAVWAADVVVKVKEPQPSEHRHLRDGLTLFAFLHLAAEPELTSSSPNGACGVRLRDAAPGGELPMLAPMSEIAGRAAAIVAAATLSSASGGSGVLLGGAAGVPPAEVVVIGMGVAGRLAAHGIRGLGGHVTGVDVDLPRLLSRRLDGVVDATQISEPRHVDALVRGADVVIGAALVPGGRAPVVVTEESVARCATGSVVVDLAIDQGGCVATSRPTTLSEPTFTWHGVCTTR
jgi:alanine dehydrogenase